MIIKAKIMAEILRHLNINGSEYNVGYSQNDLTNELKAKYDAAEQNAINAGKVTISEAAGSGDILKTYTFTQNGAEIGKINIAKDLVVSGGEIVEKNGEKYLSLSIANQEAPVEIPVKDLVDVYTGSAYINITNANVVELKLSDLDAELVKETSQVGAKIKVNADAVAAEKTRAEQVESGLRTDLGQSGDAAGTGSAFARIKSLEEDMDALSGGAGSVSSQIDSKINAYDAETVQPIAERVSDIESDYLKAADKTELQGNIDKKVAQAEYNEDKAAIEKSISDNAEAIDANAKAINANAEAISANTEDISTMGQKLAGVSDNAKNVTTAYDATTETLTITIA